MRLRGNSGSDDEAPVVPVVERAPAAPTERGARRRARPRVEAGKSLGPDATVDAVSAEQLRAGAGLAGIGRDLTVAPRGLRHRGSGIHPDIPTSISKPDGSQAAVPSLIGAVQTATDWRCWAPDRSVGGPAAGGDPAGFADLIEEARQMQAGALG
ncbi:MAG: hypothetical protein JWQ45_907 [Blastococcus sp.]|nr:hypothetical protein [Blastococcus sp.]